MDGNGCASNIGTHPGIIGLISGDSVVLAAGVLVVNACRIQIIDGVYPAVHRMT